jgi:ferredoxin-NADP reductase
MPGMMGREETMHGPSPGMSMSQMMRGPSSTEFYPTLIRTPEPDPVERKRLERRAEQWISEGRSLLSDGADALSESTRRDDVPGIEQAGAVIAQGLSRLKSGLAARGALESGEPPPLVAQEWFKTQLNLLPTQMEPKGARVLGMTPFQLFLCTLMILAIGVSLTVYVQRMRRASHLIERIVAGSAGEEGVPETATERRVDATPPPASAQIEVSGGMLPIKRKKLCRLRVARIYPETPDIKTFRFISCDRGPIPFSYLPGQFLTLSLPIEGNPTKRSYTISSSPAQGYYCEISVKREDRGLGSRYLHDVLREGDTLEVRGPSGKLTFTGKEADSIVLIGGGVGITPMMSVTRALADMGWGGEITLVVACSDVEHFLFGAEIERLKARNPNLNVRVAMSALEEDHSDFHRGRITKDLLEKWLPDIAARPRIHLCASPGLMEAVKQMLADLGVLSERIKTESFGSQEKPIARASVRATQPKAAPIESASAVEFQRSAKSTAIQAGESVLEAAERIGVEMNYSCRVGSCGECAVRLISGEVKMEVEDALVPADKDAGIILGCQAHPISNVVVEA